MGDTGGVQAHSRYVPCLALVPLVLALHLLSPRSPTGSNLLAVLLRRVLEAPCTSGCTAAPDYEALLAAAERAAACHAPPSPTNATSEQHQEQQQQQQQQQQQLGPAAAPAPPPLFVAEATVHVELPPGGLQLAVEGESEEGEEQGTASPPSAGASTSTSTSSTPATHAAAPGPAAGPLVLHLPPIRVRLGLPADYPASAPPHVRLLVGGCAYTCC